LDRAGDEEKAYSRRGRAKEKGGITGSPSTSVARTWQTKEQFALSKFGEILKLEHDDTQAGDGWKEFKKGKRTHTTLLFNTNKPIHRDLYIPNILLHTGKLAPNASVVIWNSHLASQSYGPSSRGL
jgi:hypothetical protein